MPFGKYIRHLLLWAFFLTPFSATNIALCPLSPALTRSFSIRGIGLLFLPLNRGTRTWLKRPIYMQGRFGILFPFYLPILCDRLTPLLNTVLHSVISHNNIFKVIALRYLHKKTILAMVPLLYERVIPLSTHF